MSDDRSITWFKLGFELDFELILKLGLDASFNPTFKLGLKPKFI